MKKIILITSFFIAFQGNAQEENTSTNDSTNIYNRWTVEAMTGFSDGNYPYGTGFGPGDKKHVLSHFKINSFDVGLRYMVTPKFGFKANLAYAKYTESDNSSLPYETNQYTFAFQGVINAARVLDFKSDSRIGLLVHGGIHVASLTSKTETTLDAMFQEVPNPYYESTEYHGGFVAGITPQYRITPKLALFADLSMYFNYRQHMNWNGTVANTGDLYGKSTNLSFGISYSLGKDKIHGDWKVLKSENELKTAALQNELKNKIEDIEVMLQDTDRDGVVDYLDAEPNTIGGVAVDTKGRAIDVNKNGVPDELEPRDGKRGLNTYDDNEATSFNYLVDQGIVNIFFDTNKDTPNTASANNLYYIINFLKKHPEAKVRARGFADTTGDEKKNEELAQKRAMNSKEFIVKSGISADRIEILGSGEDASMDTTSKTGRQLARRVSFELIK